LTTRRSEPTILTGSWDFAVRAFSLLTTPRADIDRCDRDVETLARHSLAGGLLHTMSLAIRRAWMASRGRTCASWLASTLMPQPGAAAWRVGGWIVAVTGATALAVTPLATLPNGPLVWVVPALLVASGLLVMVLAGPLARAAADRRSSDSHEA
jgi:hypothetical protein